MRPGWLSCELQGFPELELLASTITPGFSMYDLEMELRSRCLRDKHSTHWAVSSTPESCL